MHNIKIITNYLLLEQKVKYKLFMFSCLFKPFSEFFNKKNVLSRPDVRYGNFFNSICF